MAIVQGFFGLVVAALAIWVGYVGHTKEHAWYRFKTTMRAVQALQNTPKEQIEGFLKAYDMFYIDFFNITTAEQEKYTTDYYKTLNHLCAIGNYEKMYLPPFIDGSKDTYSNQRIYEKRMASQLGLAPGKLVLDIGCGRGRIAHHVAETFGANVIGLNLDADQIRQANEFAQASGIGERLSFVEANYNLRLPFPDNHFDAVYYVQVIGGYGTDLSLLFKEIYRVLKPGGKAAFEDYIKLPKYDENNAYQKNLVQASKAILGVTHYYSDKEYLDAFASAKLDIIYRQNGSKVEQAGLLMQDKEFFVPLTALVSTLNSAGLVPEHYAKMLQRMTQGTDECILAHTEGLVTGDIETVVQKPIGAASAAESVTV